MQFQLLPFKIESQDLVKLYQETTKTVEFLAKWRNDLATIPCANELLSVFSMIEAVESTRIEGTQTTLSDVYEDIAKKKTTIDTNEVLNYNKALQYGIDEIQKHELLTIRTIKKIHELLLQGDVRGKNKAPGEFRKIDNWIGANGSTMENASHIPPSHIYVAEYMKNLEEYINNDALDNDLHPLMKAAVIHVQFETIHPFLDGNGRVGRILIILYLYLKGTIPNSSFFVSKELERNKFKYYDLLNGCRKNPPQIVDWVSFFLSCVVKEAENQKRKMTDVNILLNKYWDLYANDSYRHVLFTIFKNPIFTVRSIEVTTGLSYNTVNKYLKILEKEKFIYSNGKQHKKMYFCYDLLNVFNSQ